MLTIKDKIYYFGGNMSMCHLKVMFNEDSRFYNMLPYDIRDMVEKRFIHKHKRCAKKVSLFTYEFNIKGVARCNENKDEFNEEKGAKIALHRALLELNKWELELMGWYRNELVKMYGKLDGWMARTENHIQISEIELKSLTK